MSIFRRFSPSTLFWSLVFLAITLPLLWGIFHKSAAWYHTADPESFSAWGSSFALLGTIFTGVAMAGGILAYRLQQDSLREQSKFITEQREALAKQSEALDQEAYDRQKQNLNHVFFQLIDRINRTLSEACKNNGSKEGGDGRSERLSKADSGHEPHPAQDNQDPKVLEGKLSIVAQEFLAALRAPPLPQAELPEADQNVALPKAVQALLSKRPLFSQVLHLNTSVLSLLDNSGLKENDIELYLELLRAHYSEEHLLLLMLGGLDPHHPKLKAHIERHGLLLHFASLTTEKHHRELGEHTFFEIAQQHYAASAFEAPKTSAATEAC